MSDRHYELNIGDYVVLPSGVKAEVLAFTPLDNNRVKVVTEHGRKINTTAEHCRKINKGGSNE